jgi:hypothetical protein
MTTFLFINFEWTLLICFIRNFNLEIIVLVHWTVLKDFLLTLKLSLNCILLSTSSSLSWYLFCITSFLSCWFSKFFTISIKCKLFRLTDSSFLYLNLSFMGILFLFNQYRSGHCIFSFLTQNFTSNSLILINSN